MIIESKTNCRKVCAIQETMTITSCDWIALGSEIKAMNANRYAQAIVPTPEVTNTANLRLNLLITDEVMVQGY